MGGYAEARYLPEIIDYVSSNVDFQGRYPYSIIGAFGKVRKWMKKRFLCSKNRVGMISKH